MTFRSMRNVGVYTSTLVMRDRLPVLLVFHDEDGAWQFLASTEEDPDSAMYVHLGHLLDGDPTLEEVADLPAGWKAWRWTVGNDWVKEKTPADQGGL